MREKRGEFTVSWDERHEYIISALLFQAENGDVKAARELAGHAAQWLKDNKPLPEDLWEYLSNALAAIAESKRADHALKLIRKPGPVPDLQKEYKIAKAVRREIRKDVHVQDS